MSKVQYIDRRLRHRDHICKNLRQRLVETIRDYTINLIVDSVSSASRDRELHQAELLVAFDPVIEQTSERLGKLQKQMGFVAGGTFADSNFDSDWPGEKRAPELELKRMTDEALEGSGKADYSCPPANTGNTLEFSRYPVILGTDEVSFLMKCSGKDDYRGFHPPIEIKKYHLTDFLTLRRFRKEIRQLPHATVISTTRHSWVNL